MESFVKIVQTRMPKILLQRKHVLNPAVFLDPRSGAGLLACGSVKGFCFLTTLIMHLGI